MNVLFIVPGTRKQASTRYRVLNLIPYLEDEEFDCDVISLNEIRQKVPGPNLISELLFAVRTLINTSKYDVIFIQKIPFPKGFTEILKKLNNNVIYDFDDALYTTPKWETRNEKKKSDFNHIISKASIVLAGSPILTEYAREFSDRVFCMPTSLPREKYAHRWGTKSSCGELTKIGWIGNNQNLHYLLNIKDPLAKVLDKYDKVSLEVITSKERSVSPLIERDDVFYREWSLEKELDYLSEIDIGIRPLIDDEWTRGKGGFTSVIQMMALEIPVVVTPVAFLKEFVRHGETGYHAKTEREWIIYLSEMIENPKTRIQYGQNARKLVSEYDLWVEKRAEELKNYLRSFNVNCKNDK